VSGERILVVDDDGRLVGLLTEYLGDHGFVVESRLTGGEGLARLAMSDQDVVILDVMLPDMDGFEVLRRIRSGSDVPVLMLTARGDETDRIVGLEIGADDYLPRPFNPRQLHARLRAILRRRRPPDPESRTPLVFGELVIDRASRRVSLRGRTCRLTSYQYDLLRVLAENAGRVLSRDVLMDATKGETWEAFDRSIDVHVSRIRAAIEDDPKSPRRIVTVRGAGYVFTDEAERDAP